jgi:hypothetical protein
VHSREIDWTALKLMLEGIEVKRRMKRYRLERNEVESSDAEQAASIASTNADRVVPTSARRR